MVKVLRPKTANGAASGKSTPRRRAASNPQKKMAAARQMASGRPISQPSNPTFGPVSTVSTAPVAIGNSMKGFRAKVVNNSVDSVRVVGRDFAVTATSTGNVTGWTLCAGIPLTPAAFISSVLRSYTQIYNKFRINQVCVHYITSSPTTSTGDVMFQVNSNRSDPMPNWSLTTFLPYALSKEETIIGPQWTNHSCCIKPRGPTRSLVPGSNNDIDYQSQGEIQLFSKTSTVDSPGYLLMDYDITFMEMSVNPRSGLLPNPLIMYTPTQLTLNVSAYTTAAALSFSVNGTTFIGQTAITALSSNPYIKPGDIFKVVIDATDSNSSSWTFTAGSATLASLAGITQNGTVDTFPIGDGFTCYALYQSPTNVRLYPNPTDAFVATNPLTGGGSYTPAVYVDNSHNPNAGVWLYAWFSWVGTLNPQYLQQQ
jgi:hypothetical protein